jgi:hypothetical protein
MISRLRSKIGSGLAVLALTGFVVLAAAGCDQADVVGGGSGGGGWDYYGDYGSGGSWSNSGMFGHVGGDADGFYFLDGDTSYISGW